MFVNIIWSAATWPPLRFTFQRVSLHVQDGTNQQCQIVLNLWSAVVVYPIIIMLSQKFGAGLRKKEGTDRAKKEAGMMPWPTKRYITAAVNYLIPLRSQLNSVIQVTQNTCRRSRCNQAFIRGIPYPRGGPQSKSPVRYLSPRRVCSRANQTNLG